MMEAMKRIVIAAVLLVVASAHADIDCQKLITVRDNAGTDVAFARRDLDTARSSLEFSKKRRAKPEEIRRVQGVVTGREADVAAKVRAYEAASADVERCEAAVAEERAAAEKERAEVEAANRAFAERLAALRRDPKVVRVAMSALMCYYAAERRAILEEVATEKKYAKIGGVESRTKLYALQQNIRRVDETIAERKRDLSFLKLKPIACKDKSVMPILLCLAAGENAEPSCDAPPTGDGFLVAATQENKDREYIDPEE